MISILALVLGGLLGLYVSHRAIVEPLWGVERDLRKELGKVRGELYTAKHGRPFDIPDAIQWAIPSQREWEARYLNLAAGPPAVKPSVVYHPEPIVPHRTHSEVLFIPHPEDLFK